MNIYEKLHIGSENLLKRLVLESVKEFRYDRNHKSID